MNQAELILTSKGEIYHLKLKPGQLAPNIITVGDPKRIELFIPYFDSIDCRISNREFSTLTGIFKGKPLSVMATGIGTDNIDIAMTEADALFNIDFGNFKAKKKITPLTFIRMGTSGGLQEDIEVGDIVLSAAAVGLDNLYYFYQSKGNRWSEVNNILSQSMDIRTYTCGADSALLEHFEGIGKTGITMTCPGFYGPQGRALRTPIQYPNLLENLSALKLDEYRLTNFEMETAGIFAMAEILGHRALSISGILAHRKKGTFADAPQLIVEDLIDKSMNALESWLT